MRKGKNRGTGHVYMRTPFVEITNNLIKIIDKHYQICAREIRPLEGENQSLFTMIDFTMISYQFLAILVLF